MAVTDTELTQSEAQEVLQELDEAAELANEALNKPAKEPAPEGEETEAQRAERQQARVRMFMQRAARQRNRGREEMGRVYPGVMVVDQELKVYDPNLASSVVRFAALTDRTLHILKRIGRQYMSQAQLDKLLEAIQEKIAHYCKEGRTNRAAAEELNQRGREESLMWLEPRYAAPALEANFSVKTKPVLTLIEGARHWDEGIRLMCEAEFNGSVSESQISDIRLSERRLFSDINRLCANTVIGLRTRTLEKVESNTEKQAETETQSAEA